MCGDEASAWPPGSEHQGDSGLPASASPVLHYWATRYPSVASLPVPSWDHRDDVYVCAALGIEGG